MFAFVICYIKGGEEWGEVLFIDQVPPILLFSESKIRKKDLCIY